MTVEYDKGIDAAYIRLRDTKILESEELASGVVADFDAEDALVGLEILCVKDRTIEQLRKIGYKFEEADRIALGELFHKFASAFSSTKIQYP
jgi:uncharacterized protein YuzE